MSTSSNNPRALDHLVLPVEDIEEARDRYTALGFTVAPTGTHPFGTENCCIFLSDGTFLEPLGIAHRETCEANAKNGNTFVRNDIAYRFRCGSEGLSHLVVKSDNAEADHNLYTSEGISAGPLGGFKREFATPDGQTGQAEFKLAFANDYRSPDAQFFACEVVGAPKVDRAPLMDHANGATRLKHVILSEVNPTDFQYFFQVFLNQREMDTNSFGMSFEASNGTVSVLSPDGMKAFYGIECESHARGMLFQAFVIGVGSLEQTKTCLEQAAISFEEKAQGLFVHPDSGQGTTLIFESDQ